MLIGESNCGKSMLLNPLKKIFDRVAKKPAKKSSYPLQHLLDADCILWHEAAWRRTRAGFGACCRGARRLQHGIGITVERNRTPATARDAV